MILIFFAATKYFFKNAYIKTAIVIICLAIIGLSIVSHYGISSDEAIEISMVKWNLNLITKGEPIPSNLKHYGTLFNVTSEAVFQLKEFWDDRVINNSISSSTNQKSINHSYKFYERIKIKHICTFLVSLITYASVAGIVGILAGRQYAWFGAVVLALFPRFWGHSFFNPKDIPFAAMFTLATFLGACLINYYLKADQDNIKLGINRVTLYSLLYGILVGFVTGTRIGGFFLLFFVVIAHLLAVLVKKKNYRKLYRFWSLYGLMVISWMTIITIIHPASWSNPIGWFIETLRYLSKHGWSGTVLFEGQFISAHQLPWYYLPKWFLMTIPGIFIIMFFLGLLLLIIKLKKLNDTQTVCVVLVLLQIFTLPTIAILRQSTIYDGVRQFLFVIPGIAAIAATALLWIYQKLHRKNYKIFFAVLIITLFSPIVFDMVNLHPYEYVYFNRISGGLVQADNRYETDYWGLSMRDGMEWINNNSIAGEIVVSSSQLHSSKTFAKHNINVISHGKFKKLGTTQAFYYIARPRWDFQERFPECPVVYSVNRQGVPLTIVKKCG
ncbi:ArnT family glycosyltransferase [Coleofasciculus chthonoplastes]|uniref:ArnT family glycosyltransferase n=1 Tax=Coleofasciculus chthonoplastes TaxID=64178 RepID=UPI0032FD5342